MARKLHAIINPSAGNGRTVQIWQSVRSRVGELDISVEEHLTNGSGDATRIATELAHLGVEDIAVFGGDGTLNEVINGLYATSNGSPIDTRIAAVPCGTGRDFARSLGVGSIDAAIELLAHGEAVPIDLGLVRFQNGSSQEERVFANMADVGLGAETAALMNRSSKVLGGFLSYMVGAARSIIVFKGRPAQVIIDGEMVHDGPVGMVVLANGRFHAGGMLLAPMASLTDGLLEVLILHDVPKLTLLGSLLPRVYRGTHIGHSAVRHFTARTVEVRSNERLAFEMDGEQPGTTDLQAQVIPGAIRVRAPRSTMIRPRIDS